MSIEQRNAPGLASFAETAYVRGQRSSRLGGELQQRGGEYGWARNASLVERRALTTVGSMSMVHAVHVPLVMESRLFRKARAVGDNASATHRHGPSMRLPSLRG